MRTVLALALLWAAPALAQRCPGSNQSWSFSLQPPQQFAVYDLTNAPPGAPAGLTTVLWPVGPTTTNSTIAFVNVPQTIVQQWQVAGNTYTFYQQRIYPVYHALLIEQGQPFQNCPLCGPDGVCPWTK